MKNEHPTQAESDYFAKESLRRAAIRLNSELFRLFPQMPRDDELTKAILAVRTAIVNAGGFQ